MLSWSGSTLRRTFRKAAYRLIAGATLWLVVAPSAATAAQIDVVPVPKYSKGVFITIVGEITATDVDKFRQLAVLHDDALVTLSSNGGNMYSAVEIGRIIRLKGYSTWVTNLAPCNSACALIFISGARRALSKSAKVGFHATYLDNDGKKLESGVGNAVVGSYMAQLNYSETAIVFATSAPPNKLNELTVSNAAENGISVEQLADLNAGTHEKKQEDTHKSVEPGIYGRAGAWTVAVDDSLAKGCDIFANYGDIVFQLGVDARTEKHSHYLRLYRSSWNSIESGKIYKISVTFDAGNAWDISPSGYNTDGWKGLSFPFDQPDFLAEFSRAKEVNVVYQGRSIAHLSLADITPALTLMDRCQSEQTAAEADPFHH